MMISKTHPEDAALFAWAEDRAKDGVVSNEVTAHLASCAECGHRIRQYRALFGGAAKDLHSAPNDLLQRAINAAGNGPSLPPEPSHKTRDYRERMRLPLVTGAIAEAVLGKGRTRSRVLVGILMAAILGGGAGYWVSQPHLNDAIHLSDSKTITPEEFQAAENEGTDRMKRLARAVITYAEDWDERLPPMKDVDGFLYRIKPYVKDRSDLLEPLTGQPFMPNATASGWALARFEYPKRSVLLFDPRPAADGSRKVAVVTGQVRRVDRNEWGSLNRIVAVTSPSLKPLKGPRLAVVAPEDRKPGGFLAEGVSLRDVVARLYLEERRFWENKRQGGNYLTTNLRNRFRAMQSLGRKQAEAVGHADMGTFGWFAYQKYFSPLSDEDLGVSLDPQLKHWVLNYSYLPERVDERTVRLRSGNQNITVLSDNWISPVYRDLEERYGLDIQHEKNRIVIKPE